MFHGYPYTDFHELNLDQFLSRFKSLLAEWAKMQTDFDDMQDKLDELQDIFDLVTKDMPAYIKTVLVQKLKEILTSMIYVWISDDGYIVYYIPDGWEDVIFNTTGWDIEIPDREYGHLVLSLYVNN